MIDNLVESSYEWRRIKQNQKDTDKRNKATENYLKFEVIDHEGRW